MQCERVDDVADQRSEQKVPKAVSLVRGDCIGVISEGTRGRPTRTPILSNVRVLYPHF